MNNKEKLEKSKCERLGLIKRNKESLGGYEMKIVEYYNATNVIIEFQDKYKVKITTTYNSFKNGCIKNPYHRSVYNVGYIGEGKYTAKGKDGKHTKAYIIWQSMLKRCYDAYYINKHSTYIDCIVCEEWHNFQNFTKWFYKNYYEVGEQKMHLDKDILYKCNKIYSPKTCVFVPQRINCLFVKANKHRGVCPIGVAWHKRDGVYESSCAILNKENKNEKIYLGRYDNKIDAFNSYKLFKENYIKQVANEYKDFIPSNLYEAMLNYEVEIND